MSTMVCSGKSDVGRRRSNNEDAFLVRADLGLLSVADGMGGAASGELASSIFVETAAQVFGDRARNSGQTIHELVQNTFLLANKGIIRQSKDDPRHTGMGCTAELLTFDNESYIVGHVGDSRTYLFRGGLLRQVTKDHSLVQEQIDKGLITTAEAKTHSFRSVIMRAVGVADTLAVDLIRGKRQPGDLFLLCSDGLTDMVENERIAEILSLGLSPDQTAERLIESANTAGGFDNITVVLCRIGP